MKFALKKDKKNAVVDQTEYIEDPDSEDRNEYYETRPKTSQSTRGGDTSYNNNNNNNNQGSAAKSSKSNFLSSRFAPIKKKQYNANDRYNDEVDYEEDEFNDDLDGFGSDEYENGEDDEDDFDRKYRKEMRELNKQVGKTVKHDDLSEETKKILHETFENFYEKESVAMIDMIEDSRKEVADSVLELMDEQKRLKDELNRLSNGKYGKPKKENVISLSLYLKRKRGEGSFEAFSSPAPNQAEQSPSDKMAVEKYVKKKERQKVAETNKLAREKTSAMIETETKEILTKLQAVDINSEKNRERQMEKIKMKLKDKITTQKNDQEVANEIMENYNESKIAQDRERQLQQERIRARLKEAKDSGGRPLTGIGAQREYSNADGFSTAKTNKSIPAIEI